MENELQREFPQAGLSRPDRRPGSVVRRDGHIAFLEASLYDPDEQVVATGTATLRVVPLEPALEGRRAG